GQSILSEPQRIDSRPSESTLLSSSFILKRKGSKCFESTLRGPESIPNFTEANGFKFDCRESTLRGPESIPNFTETNGFKFDAENRLLE
ncbi:hypothetical protein PIB30_105746, partial [Stylosanthes scabra]|nr:hypothetical protein [Stylosanthes scabra]